MIDEDITTPFKEGTAVEPIVEPGARATFITSNIGSEQFARDEDDRVSSEMNEGDDNPDAREFD